MRTVRTVAVLAALLAVPVAAFAQAPGVMVEPGPVFWKKIQAAPGVFPLTACRQVFGVAGVFDATRGFGNTVYCKVTFADLYTPGETKQNFSGGQ